MIFSFYESICFNNGRIAVFGECMKERTLYKLRLRFYLLVLCVYTILLIWITKQRNGLLTTLLIVILLKRLFYNTRFILFSNGCKYVFMPLTKLIQTYTTWKWWTFNYYVYFIITVNTYLFKYVAVKLGFIIFIHNWSAPNPGGILPVQRQRQWYQIVCFKSIFNLMISIFNLILVWW